MPGITVSSSCHGKPIYSGVPSRTNNGMIICSRPIDRPCSASERFRLLKTRFQASRT
ncbi:hypothetical protein D3C78_1938210 [compost metagenome]